jgi:hypothetical protein
MDWTMKTMVARYQKVILGAGVLLLVLASSASPVFAYPYSSNSNVFVGLSGATPECSAMSSPHQYVDFNSSMLYSSLENGWTAQVNAYSSSSNTPGVVIMQNILVVNVYGDIFGVVQYWTSSTNMVVNLNSSRLTTVTNVASGDDFLITTTTNSTGVDAVSFSYYESATSTEYTQTVHLTKTYTIPIYSWQLNIVGNKNGNDVEFSSGGGSLNYSPGSSGSLTYVTSQPSCTQIGGHSYGTGETSNMGYDTPTTSAGDVYQNMEYKH